MAQDDNDGKDTATRGSLPAGDGPPETPGTAVIVRDAVHNPGLPPHQPRITDVDPKAERNAERAVYTLFYLSVIGSIFAIAAYIAFPLVDGDAESVRRSTLFIGLGMTLALMGIGLGAVHWGKALMHNHEGIDLRHPQRSSDENRAAAVAIIGEANTESGFGRRTMIRNSLLAALVAFPLPAVVLFRGLAPMDKDPVELLRHTMWDKNVRLTHDPSGAPIRAADVTLGSSYHVIPEGLAELTHHKIEEKAKAIVLLMRLKPEELIESPERKSWSYDGIVAYSKVCTHVGCPVALYEQQVHHLLCPCHQSQFDVTDHCKVIFGPAKRPLPQLPITVDADGYLVAQSDFREPVGPSFWERS